MYDYFVPSAKGVSQAGETRRAPPLHDDVGTISRERGSTWNVLGNAKAAGKRRRKECVMWVPSLSIAELVLRGVVVYLVLFALIRFIGAKHVGELSPLDLVVLLIISETVNGSLIADDNSLTGGLVSAATLIGLVQIVGYLTSRSRRVERCVDGTPKILVRHGRADQAMMRQEQVTRAELAEALRQNGCASITKVRLAILETDGTISVLPRKQGDG